jgi:peptidoglycan LD-endopeptidase LytH
MFREFSTFPTLHPNSRFEDQSGLLGGIQRLAALALALKFGGVPVFPLWVFMSGCLLPTGWAAEGFAFPTANRALLDPDGGERFLVSTPGRTWESGGYGCVRSEGWQLHEGLDIRSIDRDARNEPVDPVMAAAAGSVAYVSRDPALSNYGNYIILRHQVEGLEVFSFYAHLASIDEGMTPGREVGQGEVLGIMGRTANTGDRISKARAHVHFEVGLQINERFPEWVRESFPDQRNDHGVWNGQNFIGVDPAVLLTRGGNPDKPFGFLNFLHNQVELCRVMVLETDFPWLHRYARLIRRNPPAELEGIAGFELVLNFAGLPFEIVPRAPSEIQSLEPVTLLSVNAEEKVRNPCGKIVVQRDGEWRLTNTGMRRIDLLTY